jgi:hypothetical protein
MYLQMGDEGLKKMASAADLFPKEAFGSRQLLKEAEA